MDAQELRNLQEAYMEVVENQQLDEGYKDLPMDKMRGKVIKHAASGAKRAYMNNLSGNKGTTQGNVEDAKATKSLNKAKKIQAEIKSREGLGKDFYAGLKKSRSKFKRGNVNREQVDIYDIILSHLLDEGYAETIEAAEVMMVNMSEEWRETIMEREYGPDEILPGSGRTPKQKYRAKRGRFMKSKKPSQNETGRQRAQRMAQNYYIGTTKQQYDNFGIGN
jgi:hypothetical protein